MPKPSEPDRALAGVLRELRLKQGRTQEDLAHDVGLTVVALGRIERAQAAPTWSTVRNIAQALGVTLEQLGTAVDKAETAGRKSPRGSRSSAASRRGSTTHE